MQADFGQLAGQIGGPSAEELTKKIDKLAELEDLQSVAKSSLQLQDIAKKADLIDSNTIRKLHTSDIIAQTQENKNLGKVDSLIAVQQSVDRLTNLLQDQFTKLSPALAIVLPQLIGGINSAANDISKSRGARGIGGKKPWEN